MRHRKSYSTAFAFFALCAVSVVACDPAPQIANMISNALTDGMTGGGCGGAGCGGAGCGDCSSCSSCSSCGSCDGCSGCDGCSIDCGPIRNAAGVYEGFQGVHPRSGSPANVGRIDHIVQARLSQPGIAFVESMVAPLADAAVPPIDLADFATNGTFPVNFDPCDTIGLPINCNVNLGNVNYTVTPSGSVAVDVVDFQLGTVDALSDSTCVGNATNGLGGPHDCIRSNISATVRSCSGPNGTCATAQDAGLSVALSGLVNMNVACTILVDPSGRGARGDFAVRADATTVPQAATPAAHAGLSSLAVLDAELDEATLEGGDYVVVCPNVTDLSLAEFAALWVAGSGAFTGVSTSCSGLGLTLCGNGACQCSINPSGLVTNTVNILRDGRVTDPPVQSVNEILDYQLGRLGRLCAPAANANDCPANTTYVPPTAGATTGTCTISSGADSGKCMEMVLGLESRVGLGSALAAVTPGIEAVVDMLAALYGHGAVYNNGFNVDIAGGMDTWVAGIRALGHNPCVPIEYPADNQAECDALPVAAVPGPAGLVYETIPNGGKSGRCVPPTPILPEVVALRNNTVPGSTLANPDYEIGVGISEAFIQYATWKVWDSGATCLDVGTSLSPLMSPSLISFAFLTQATQPRIFFPLDIVPGNGGMAGLTDTRSLALSLRPQGAPIITMDEVDDPCEPGVDKRLEIDVRLDKVHLGLSIWGDDRYARIGTIETDLHVVVALDLGDQTVATETNECKNLAAGEVGIALPVLKFANARWLPDAPLLGPSDFRIKNGRTVPQLGLDTIGGIGGSIAAAMIPGLNAQSIANDIILGLGTTLGSVPPVHVEFHKDAFQLLAEDGPCSSGIYDSGTRNAGTCTNHFLGMFIDLEPGAPVPAMLQGSVETTVEVTNVTIPEERAGFDMQSETFGEGVSPTVEIVMGASGVENAEFEYAYRTSATGWSDWQRSPYAILSGPGLFLQGELEVYARARVAGVPSSEDRTSARATYVVDVTPPMIEVYAQPDGSAQLQALDLVGDALEYRVTEPGEDASSWSALPATGVVELDVPDGTVFEVRDEEGNVASTAEALQGRPSAADASACGSCSTVGVRSTVPPLAAFGMLLAAVAVVRRRRLARRPTR